MKVKIITAGKPKGDFHDLFQKYIQRLSYFADLEVVHIKEGPKMEEKILKNSNGSFKIILDENGKEFSSKELSKFIEKKENIGENNLVFIIGPADGHSKTIRLDADFVLSLSKLTFPHDLSMIILSETLYRSFSILKNHPYHKE